MDEKIVELAYQAFHELSEHLGDGARANISSLETGEIRMGLNTGERALEAILKQAPEVSPHDLYEVKLKTLTGEVLNNVSEEYVQTPTQLSNLLYETV